MLTLEQQDQLGLYLHLLETSHVENPHTIISACMSYIEREGWRYIEAPQMANLVPSVEYDRFFPALGFSHFDQQLIAVVDNIGINARALTLLHECVHLYQRTVDPYLFRNVFREYGYMTFELQAEEMACLVNETLGGDSRAATEDYLSIWRNDSIPAAFTSGWVRRNVQEFMSRLMA